MYIYDPIDYRSPQRLVDPDTGEFLDQWQHVTDMILILPDGRRIISPKGEITDKASIPRIAWWWMPRDDKNVIIAARFHDHLYVVQSIEGKPIPRAAADKIFYDLMRDAGMNWFRAKTAYLAVKAGGWITWNRRAKAREV